MASSVRGHSGSLKADLFAELRAAPFRWNLFKFIFDPWGHFLPAATMAQTGSIPHFSVASPMGEVATIYPPAAAPPAYAPSAPNTKPAGKIPSSGRLLEQTLRGGILVTRHEAGKSLKEREFFQALRGYMAVAFDFHASVSTRRDAYQLLLTQMRHYRDSQRASPAGTEPTGKQPAVASTDHENASANASDTAAGSNKSPQVIGPSRKVGMSATAEMHLRIHLYDRLQSGNKPTALRDMFDAIEASNAAYSHEADSDTQQSDAVATGAPIQYQSSDTSHSHEAGIDTRQSDTVANLAPPRLQSEATPDLLLGLSQIESISSGPGSAEGRSRQAWIKQLHSVFINHPVESRIDRQAALPRLVNLCMKLDENGSPTLSDSERRAVLEMTNIDVMDEREEVLTYARRVEFLTAMLARSGDSDLARSVFRVAHDSWLNMPQDAPVEQTARLIAALLEAEPKCKFNAQTDPLPLQIIDGASAFLEDNTVAPDMEIKLTLHILDMMASHHDAWRQNIFPGYVHLDVKLERILNAFDEQWTPANSNEYLHPTEAFNNTLLSALAILIKLQQHQSTWAGATIISQRIVDGRTLNSASEPFASRRLQALTIYLKPHSLKKQFEQAQAVSDRLAQSHHAQGATVSASSSILDDHYQRQLNGDMDILADAMKMHGAQFAAQYQKITEFEHLLFTALRTGDWNDSNPENIEQTEAQRKQATQALLAYPEIKERMKAIEFFPTYAALDEVNRLAILVQKFPEVKLIERDRLIKMRDVILAMADKNAVLPAYVAQEVQPVLPTASVRD